MRRRRSVEHGKRLSQADHLEIQKQISGGATFATAAAAVGCSIKSIQRLMARTGGLMQRVRERSPLRLSFAEREELSRGLGAGHSLRRMAARLGRAPSTVSREVAWNGHRDSIVLGAPTGRQSGGRRDPSRRNWRSIHGSAAKWSVGYSSSGRPSRSRRVSSVTILG